MLNDIYLVNEIDSATFRLIPLEVEVEAFFRKHLADYLPLLEQKNIEMSLEIDQSERKPSFVLDPERVSQIIDNLVMNSYRFTPKSGRIKVRVQVEEHTISFHIFDTGPGFKTKDYKKVFHKFYQEDSSRSKQKGHTGLGLYIARTIAQKHRGDMHAEGSVDPLYRGAHVWFKIGNLNKEKKGDSF
ncbi:sensor histidine kinase [Caldalkalibacillus mannanilyticus]|uniref:sensor histidine kinase n=1 Tax=Caldalkalibacillus mannanilyticus TaxID=1418 RepID=UPI00131F366E|nr:ATP-binding protein [Caldalkalibacillus mannanilyticus]